MLSPSNLPIDLLYHEPVEKYNNFVWGGALILGVSAYFSALLHPALIVILTAVQLF